MKHKFTLLACLVCMLFITAQAAETEPNNTKAQANTLALNSNNTGKIALNGDVDWWKVTTNADGKLDVTLTPQSGRYTWVTLYDNNGTTQLASTYTNTSTTIGADGLAVGTYYIAVQTYYSSDSSSYRLANTLTLPAQANDVEPNGTKAQALTLPLNGAKVGHIGYGYNNVRDTLDWYKVTTDANGRLRIRLTSYNSTYVWATLYDKDGATQLGAFYTNTSSEISKDGLAPGTYFIIVNCYYNNQFATYKLENNLYLPAEANDSEPNDGKTQALNLPQGGSTTGHLGYYYNFYRDTADWYKLTTNADGQIKASLSISNNTYVWVTLYDNDGTTYLNSLYTNSNADLLTDGLAAGTYYLRVNCYYNNEFANYTLSSGLAKYTNAADAESNARPYQAQTLGANMATPGHVGFYYNNKRDAEDWWKINYTGGGSLSLTLNQEPNKAGYNRYTWMEVYKDTNAAAIYSSYTISGLTANLTGLAQGYYYVRVVPYYYGEFQAYNLTPTFTQNNIAKVKISGKVIASDCSATNSMTIKCSGSKAPYTVQLYRYNVAYGNPVVIKNTAAYTFANLPSGVYKVTAFGDGATGTAFGSATATYVPVPTALSATNIQTTSAKLNWNTESCVKYYQVQYRKVGTTTWTTKKTKGNVAFLSATGLTAGTSYEWHVAPADSANGTSGLAPYSVNSNFTTATALIAGRPAAEKADVNAAPARLSVYPNPANARFTIQLQKSQGTVSLWLKNMDGTTVWSKQHVPAQSISGTSVNVQHLASGMYMLQVISEEDNSVQTAQVVIAR